MNENTEVNNNRINDGAVNFFNDPAGDIVYITAWANRDFMLGILKTIDIYAKSGSMDHCRKDPGINVPILYRLHCGAVSRPRFFKR